MSSSKTAPSSVIPDELRKILLDFTISYLMTRPPRIVEYGVRYFQTLKVEREQRDGKEHSRKSFGHGMDSEDSDREGLMASKDEESTVNGNTVAATNTSSASAIKLPTAEEKAAFRAKITVITAGKIAAIGAGDVYALPDNEATWLYHLTAKYILEKPTDIVEWGLRYCENEKDRWAYP